MKKHHYSRIVHSNTHHYIEGLSNLFWSRYLTSWIVQGLTFPFWPRALLNHMWVLNGHSKSCWESIPRFLLTISIPSAIPYIPGIPVPVFVQARTPFKQETGEDKKVRLDHFWVFINKSHQQVLFPVFHFLPLYFITVLNKAKIKAWTFNIKSKSVNMGSKMKSFHVLRWNRKHARFDMEV